MSLPRIAARDEWLAARKELLAKEKEQTRQRDALNAERRMLPMVEIDKDYVFEGPGRQGPSARPLRRPPPAHRRPLHVRPELGRGLLELDLTALGRRSGRSRKVVRPTHTARTRTSRIEPE